MLRKGAHGTVYVRAELPLDTSHAKRMTDRLLQGAGTDPDRVFVARRERLADGGTGDWCKVTYGQALAAARSIGQALLDRGLSPERPVAILSENGIEHVLLALGAMYAGIPHCPVSPAYSTVSQQYDKLRHGLATLRPGLVFAADAARYGKASAAPVGPDIDVVLAAGTLPNRATTPLAAPLQRQCRGAQEA